MHLYRQVKRGRGARLTAGFLHLSHWESMVRIQPATSMR